MKTPKARITLEDRVAALLNAGVLPVALEVVNSIGMWLVLIPPGVFRMGSPASERPRTRNSDESCHEVEITRSFSLGVFPVTQGQYRAVTGTNPSAFADGAPDQT